MLFASSNRSAAGKRGAPKGNKAPLAGGKNMSSNTLVRHAVRYALLTSVITATTTSLPTIAAEEEAITEVVVTGSRIQRQDYVANSPVITTTAEQIVANADTTLDTYLNTLPQVNAAGTSTSNN